MGFGTLDFFIVGFYLLAITAIGLLTGGKQSSANEYFLGGKNIPWWAVSFAVVATETSTLTFISIPGLAYLTNLNFLQVTFGYVIGRSIVSAIFLPRYIQGELQTAYAFLANRFGPKARNVASVTFMLTRVVADGVRLFATAIPLAIILRSWEAMSSVTNEQIYVVSIVVMAVLTLVYTAIGGVRAVIWTDVVQMFIYLVGAVAAVGVILGELQTQGRAFSLSVVPEGKFSIFNFAWSSVADFFRSPYTFVASVLGGTFLSMASHGTDHLIVQRLLTTKTLRDSQKALVTSGFVVVLQFAIFLFIGLLLFVFYNGSTLTDLGLLKADELFPKFIIEHMPTGLSGFIIAALLAAAMSTLSGSVNSLASATMNDIYKPYFGRTMSSGREVSLSRLFTMLWAVLLIGTAIFFIYNGSKVLVEIALGVASFTYGGLLGMFLLGVLTKKTEELDSIIGFIAGIVVMIFVVSSGWFGWTWYILIGSGVTIGVGSVVSFLKGRKERFMM
jgi:SSS family solute:Na+ symporter